MVRFLGFICHSVSPVSYEMCSLVNFLSFWGGWQQLDQRLRKRITRLAKIIFLVKSILRSVVNSDGHSWASTISCMKVEDRVNPSSTCQLVFLLPLSFMSLGLRENLTNSQIISNDSVSWVLWFCLGAKMMRFWSVIYLPHLSKNWLPLNDSVRLSVRLRLSGCYHEMMVNF